MFMAQEVSLSSLQPLDVIVYPGHVLIVLSSTEIIESFHEMGGVIISPLRKRIDGIRQSLTVRRFL